MITNDAKFVNAIFKGTQLAINRNESFYSIKQTQAAVTIILKANSNIGQYIISQPCNQSQLLKITNDPNFQCDILFCKRAQSNKDVHSGQICFPGGKVEQEENDFQGAIRETLEEVGIQLNENSFYLGRLPNNFNVKQNKKYMSICCHVFLVGQDVQINMNTDEIEICKWIPLKYFENLEGKIKLMKLPQFFAYHMIDDLFGNLGIPSLIKKISELYQYGYMSIIDIEMNYPLMGYTHQILAQLFNLVFQIDQSICEQNQNWKMIIQCTTLLHMKFNDKKLLVVLKISCDQQDEYCRLFAQIMMNKNCYQNNQYISLTKMDIEHNDESLVQDWIILAIANVLEQIVSETDILESPLQTMFHTNKKPSITLANYLQRIQKYGYCSNECYLMALIYIDRIQEKNSDLVINGFCIHRFLLTSILVSIKYNDDDYYKNEYYAKVGGVTLSEMNKLEEEFLELMDYQLYISQKLYYYYKDRLMQYAQM